MAFTRQRSTAAPSATLRRSRGCRSDRRVAALDGSNRFRNAEHDTKSFSTKSDTGPHVSTADGCAGGQSGDSREHERRRVQPWEAGVMGLATPAPVPEPVSLVVALLGAATQPAIGWPQNRWVAEFPEHADFLASLPPHLDHGGVRLAATRATDGPAQAVEAFLATMAWGYGRVGYARYRTALSLASPNAAQRLHAAAVANSTSGALAAYEALGASGIARLGPAFGTKYLHFCPAPRHGLQPLILDRLVARWLWVNTQTRFNPVGWLPEVYEQYLGLLHSWAEHLGVDAAAIETAIFIDQASRGSSQWGRRSAGTKRSRSDTAEDSQSTQPGPSVR